VRLKHPVNRSADNFDLTLRELRAGATRQVGHKTGEHYNAGQGQGYVQPCQVAFQRQAHDQRDAAHADDAPAAPRDSAMVSA